MGKSWFGLILFCFVVFSSLCWEREKARGERETELGRNENDTIFLSSFFFFFSELLFFCLSGFISNFLDFRFALFVVRIKMEAIIRLVVLCVWEFEPINQYNNFQKNVNDTLLKKNSISIFY